MLEKEVSIIFIPFKSLLRICGWFSLHLTTICAFYLLPRKKRKNYHHYVMSSLKQISILKHIFYNYEAILSQTFVYFMPFNLERNWTSWYVLTLYLSLKSSKTLWVVTESKSNKNGGKFLLKQEKAGIFYIL